MTTVTGRLGDEHPRAPALERSHRLTEGEIVDAALRLTRHSGLKRLTMRALAAELGVTPMATYYHVKDKHALLELVGRAVLADLELHDSGPWQERLRTVVRSCRELMGRYPGAAEFLLQTAELSTPALRLVNYCLDALHEAGFDERNAYLGYSFIHTYLFGRCNIEADMKERLDARSRREWSQAVGPVLRSLHADDYLQFGFDAMFAGLEAMLARQLQGAASAQHG